MGHLIDLPKSTIGVDIDHEFAPKFIVVRDKLKTMKKLKQEAEGVDTIYIATDPDREGEEISYHVQYLLGTDKKKIFKRVTFHEITKSAIEEALKHPGEVTWSTPSKPGAS
jgi:DNA topoisomerase-1